MGEGGHKPVAFPHLFHSLFHSLPLCLNLPSYLFSELPTAHMLVAACPEEPAGLAQVT